MILVSGQPQWHPPWHPQWADVVSLGMVRLVWHPRGIIDFFTPLFPTKGYAWAKRSESANSMTGFESSIPATQRVGLSEAQREWGELIFKPRSVVFPTRVYPRAKRSESSFKHFPKTWLFHPLFDKHLENFFQVYSQKVEILPPVFPKYFELFYQVLSQTLAILASWPKILTDIFFQVFWPKGAILAPSPKILWKIFQVSSPNGPCQGPNGSDYLFKS